jgi:hypothetical protein
VATEDLHPRQSPAQCSRLRPGRWCRSTVEDPDPATDSQKKKGDAGWCSARPLRYRMKNSNELLRLTGDVAYCGCKKFN